MSSFITAYTINIPPMPRSILECTTGLPLVLSADLEAMLTAEELNLPGDIAKIEEIRKEAIEGFSRMEPMQRSPLVVYRAKSTLPKSTEKERANYQRIVLGIYNPKDQTIKHCDVEYNFFRSHKAPSFQSEIQIWAKRESLARELLSQIENAAKTDSSSSSSTGSSVACVTIAALPGVTSSAAPAASSAAPAASSAAPAASSVAPAVSATVAPVAASTLPPSTSSTAPAAAEKKE